MPPAVVTVTSTVCAPDTAGASVVICVSETTVNDGAATVPKVTAVAPRKPLPVSVIDAEQFSGPELGDTAVMTGAGGEARITPLCPTAQARAPAMATAWRFEAVPDACALQLLPPFAVARMVPLAPTAARAVELAAATRLRLWLVPEVCAVQVV